MIIRNFWALCKVPPSYSAWLHKLALTSQHPFCSELQSALSLHWMLILNQEDHLLIQSPKR